MDATEFAKWKADKVKNGTWQGGDQPDPKYASKTTPTKFVPTAKPIPTR